MKRIVGWFHKFYLHFRRHGQVDSSDYTLI